MPILSRCRPLQNAVGLGWPLYSRHTSSIVCRYNSPRVIKYQIVRTKTINTTTVNMDDSKSKNDSGAAPEDVEKSLKDQVKLADGQDSSTVIGKLQFLLGDAEFHRWQLCQGGKGIQRSFHFKSFKQTWEFMQAVAEKCKSERHHPEWWNVCCLFIVMVIYYLMRNAGV